MNFDPKLYLDYLDGVITNCREMLDSEGFIDANTRLRLEGEYEGLKTIRQVFYERVWGKFSDSPIIDKLAKE